MPVFSGDLKSTFKKTLDAIVDDPTDNVQSRIVMPRWCSQEAMADAYVDDLAMAGPGLAQPFNEGSEIPLGDILEGVKQRYIARKWGLKLLISDEAREDTKYPEVIKAAKRLKRSLWKAVDVDSTLMLVRGWDATYPGADGQPLFSNAHVLARGGTFSNIMATPVSPSVQAMVTVRAQLMQMVGHDGLIEGYQARKVVCPPDQQGLWEVILGSSMDPGAGEFNAINVVNRHMDIELVVNQYWTTTTTNWVVLTDADDGIKFKWRRRPRSNSWVENDDETMKYSISARWARGWTDPRGAYGVQAT